MLREYFSPWNICKSNFCSKKISEPKFESSFNDIFISKLNFSSLLLDDTFFISRDPLFVQGKRTLSEESFEITFLLTFFASAFISNNLSRFCGLLFKIEKAIKILITYNRQRSIFEKKRSLWIQRVCLDPIFRILQLLENIWLWGLQLSSTAA